MQSNTSDSRGSPAAHAPPRRSRVGLLVPVIVVGATIALLVWSAWPMLRPARPVSVAQAVFDRSAASQAVERDAREADAGGGGQMVQAAGWLEAEPFMTACTALADGVVAEIEVLEGEYVEQGAVVARLVAEDAELALRRAEAALATARAEMQSAEAELRAAEREWEEPVELKRAVEVSRSSLDEARAELAQLDSLIEAGRATLGWLSEERDRIVKSRASGAASEIEEIVARQRAAAQEAEVASVEARRPLLEARVERWRAELAAAERALELRIEDERRLSDARAAKARAEAMVDSAEAERDEAALRLERMVIRAPISGYVQRRLKAPGDKVMLGMDDPHSAHLLHLYDPERLQVRVDVPLADAAHVRPGQTCEVVVEVLPDRVFAGEVLRTTHEADLQKNTLEVKVRVFDPSPVLRPEMLTRVKFLPRSAGDGASGEVQRDAAGRVLVPEEAIEDVGGLARVWAVTERSGGRGLVRSVSVEEISRAEGWVAVRGDLRPGAVLVVGADGLRDGERVVVRGERTEQKGGRS